MGWLLKEEEEKWGGYSQEEGMNMKEVEQKGEEKLCKDEGFSERRCGFYDKR